MSHEYDAGDYFEVNNDPRVDGMVITETGNIGYDGYRVAEKDTDTDNWRHYWMKAQHLHDEVNIGGLEGPRSLGEEAMEEIRANVASEPPTDTSPIPEVSVRDVMPVFTDYSNLPTNRDGSIDRERLENDDSAPEFPKQAE